MARQKLFRFTAIEKRANVIQHTTEGAELIKGKWNSLFFKSPNPITLELGCGRGEYTVGLGRKFQNRNFIGIDIKCERIWVGSTIAQDEGLGNVGFLRTHVLDIEKFFEQGEVSEVWVTFPDPRPKNRDIRRRLTSPRFLDIYSRVLKSNGIFHLKTDCTPFFEYSLDVLKARNVRNLEYTSDLYNSELLNDITSIPTRYELEFLEQGQKIKYLRCVLPKFIS